ncbi:uncharacterized protein FFNC_04402 [Fusarium fujikuroi]|nr:uncharacterized protein FFNC_04402 [Fusarium fujikuroi]
MVLDYDQSVDFCN